MGGKPHILTLSSYPDFSGQHYKLLKVMDFLWCKKPSAITTFILIGACCTIIGDVRALAVVGTNSPCESLISW